MMPRQRIYPNSIEEAVEWIIPYLVDTSDNAHRAIYFDGWRGLAASAVLREIAKKPPSSLTRKFNKIIHIDCSRWKSRRSLQRTIAQLLKLPRLMDVLDRKDEEDDFEGVDEGSRAEMREVGREISRVLLGNRCLVIFNNGSENTLDLDDFGIPLSAWFGNQVLWTFRGRLLLNSNIIEKVDNSHLSLYTEASTSRWNSLLQEEAKEIVGYNTGEFAKADFFLERGKTPTSFAEAVEECCLYLLSLNSEGGNIMDYNWATHASNYWVCDGIIEGGQDDKTWEVAARLHQQIHIEDYSFNALPSFGDKLDTKKKWIFSRGNSIVHPNWTSFFLATVTSIPSVMFHQSDKLRVLKLCRCTFSFSSPPFRRCRNLRFLGLDGCRDQQEDGVDKKDRPEMDFFKSLWILDICYTDWELDLSPEIIKDMAANIREVHIQKGRFWHINFVWRHLQNLRKLRIVDPTCPWGTGEMDELQNMVKMEFLDLSGNSTIQVMPSLSGAAILKTLILDGCVGLEHVGPEGLPPLLESFSLDACTRVDQNEEANISRISLAGCAKLVKFRIFGSLPNLEELDLSGTLVKTLDLKMVYVPSLQQIIMLGCLQLHAILWPEEGLPTLTVLHIDSLFCRVDTKPHQHAYATIMDIRFFQSLVLQRNDGFCWNNNRFCLNICAPRTTKRQSYMKEKMGPTSIGKIMGPPRQKSLTPNAYNTYIDVTTIDNMTIDHAYNNAVQFQQSSRHVEIGEGISNTKVESVQGMKAIIFVMDKAESLHVHDNSSIDTIIPEHMITIGRKKLTWRHLKQCHVMRCPNMDTVFTTNYDYLYFYELEEFWAADLKMARCIWSKGRRFSFLSIYSFVNLQSIHLYFCPRLKFVLSLSWNVMDSYLPNLETLHIVNCGDLKDVFPVKPMFPTNHKKGILEFPKLRHIYLHKLYQLQHICEHKMFAPKLETVSLRDCWGLRRLPAIGRDNRRRPVVDCEKNWWEKLEWDGLEAGHDPFLFEPRHSLYYRMHLPRVSVLR